MFRIFRKIKRIIDYIPILWNNEDWDYEHLLELIEFKLKRIKKCIRQNDIIVEHEIQEIENSIDKTLKAIDNYLYHIENFTMLDPDELYNVEMYWKKNEDRNTYSMTYKFIDGEDVPEDHEFHKYNEKYIKRLYLWQQANWNRIWNTIRDNSQKWWD